MPIWYGQFRIEGAPDQPDLVEVTDGDLTYRITEQDYHQLMCQPALTDLPWIK